MSLIVLQVLRKSKGAKQRDPIADVCASEGELDWRAVPGKENTMKHTPYARFGSHSLILRDELAIDRTLLANERTLLAYLRSGVALVIAGLTIMNLSQEVWFWMVGVACLPIGIIAGIVGVVRYRRMNNAIALVRSQQRSDPTGSANPRVNPEGGSSFDVS